jgi:hypothetical protein
MGGSFARTGLPQPVTTTSYNAANRLTQWGTATLTYDANGNMLSDGSNAFTWDARNQLASMNLGANSFQYDPLGRRVRVEAQALLFEYGVVNTLKLRNRYAIMFHGRRAQPRPSLPRTPGLLASAGLPAFPSSDF